MNRGIYVILNQTLGKQNRILVVVAFPGHKTDQRVLSKGNLAVGGRRTICDHLAGLYMIILIYDRLLVVAVALVTSLELCQMIYISVSIGISLDNDLVGSGAFYHTGILCHYADTGVNGSLCLNTGTYYRSLCTQQRHGLTLHVGSHQSTVCVIVLKEWDHSSSHGEYHLRGYVHQVNGSLLELGGFCLETSGYVIVNEMSLFIQSLVRLCHDKVVLFICSQVYYIIGDSWIGRISGLIYYAVRRFDKAVLVYSRIACQRVDQTDVGTLRSLDGAHTAIVCIVNISHLESGTVS